MTSVMLAADGRHASCVILGASLGGHPCGWSLDMASRQTWSVHEAGDG